MPSTSPASAAVAAASCEVSRRSHAVIPIILIRNLMEFPRPFLTPAAMQHRQRREFIGRVISFILFLAGLVFLAAGLCFQFIGITPESELTYYTGPAKDVTVSIKRSSRQSWDLLSFTLNDRRFVFPSSGSGFSRLVDAAKRGVPITVGYSARRMPFVTQQDRVEMYVVLIANQPIRTYQDKISEEYQASRASIVFGGGLIAVSFFVFSRCRKQRQPKS
jgi:hypothetical protein